MSLLLRFLFTCSILWSLPSFSQNTKAPKYISMAFLKSNSDEFLKMEKEVWKPVHTQIIKEGKKIAWYMYRVKYPAGEKAAYDYVRFNVYSDWNQVLAPYEGVNDIIKKVHPGMNVPDFLKETAQSRKLAWEQLFEVIDEAVTKVNQPSQFIVVNQMKTIAGAESEYVNLERTYFKPFHAERVAIGIMNNWGLYKPVMPYGNKYEYDYVTLNGFSTWEDIMKNNPPGPWQKAHGNLNFNEIHDKILQKRITVNNELWELVAFAASE